MLLVLLLLALDDDLLEGTMLDELELFIDEFELFIEELLAGVEEMLIAEELIATDDLLELEIMTLDDDLEEAGGVLDTLDDVVPHRLPFTFGAPAVPLA